MNVEMMKFTGGDEMDMMTMMLQMEKLPDFYDPFDKSPISPQIMDFSNTPTPPILFNNPDEFALSSPHLQPNLMKNCGNGFSISYSSCEKRNSNSMGAMREMIFRIAAMQPIHIDPESIKPPKRKNVKISKDPQSVAARQRRERISEKIRILQRLVPGGTKMDTASMLDEAVHYVKFLKKQVQTLEQAGCVSSSRLNCVNLNYSSALMKACQQSQMVGENRFFSL